MRCPVCEKPIYKPRVLRDEAIATLTTTAKALHQAVYAEDMDESSSGDDEDDNENSDKSVVDSMSPSPVKGKTHSTLSSKTDSKRRRSSSTIDGGESSKTGEKSTKPEIKRIKPVSPILSSSSSSSSSSSETSSDGSNKDQDVTSTPKVGPPAKTLPAAGYTPGPEASRRKSTDSLPKLSGLEKSLATDSLHHGCGSAEYTDISEEIELISTSVQTSLRLDDLVVDRDERLARLGSLFKSLCSKFACKGHIRMQGIGDVSVNIVPVGQFTDSSTQTATAVMIGKSVQTTCVQLITTGQQTEQLSTRSMASQTELDTFVQVDSQAMTLIVSRKSVRFSTILDGGDITRNSQCDTCNPGSDPILAFETPELPVPIPSTIATNVSSTGGRGDITGLSDCDTCNIGSNALLEFGTPEIPVAPQIALALEVAASVVVDNQAAASSSSNRRVTRGMRTSKKV